MTAGVTLTTGVSATNDITGKLSINGQPLVCGATFGTFPLLPQVCEIDIQFVDGAGLPISGVVETTLWLSDSPQGLGTTIHAASGGLTVTTGGILKTLDAAKSLVICSNTSGQIQFEIEDVDKNPYYVCVSVLGRPVVAAQLSPASYG
jgi:hypothetical protein